MPAAIVKFIFIKTNYAPAAIGGGNTQAADWDRAQHDPWSAEENIQ